MPSHTEYFGQGSQVNLPSGKITSTVFGIGQCHCVRGVVDIRTTVFVCCVGGGVVLLSGEFKFWLNCSNVSGGKLVSKDRFTDTDT